MRLMWVDSASAVAAVVGGSAGRGNGVAARFRRELYRCLARMVRAQNADCVLRRVDLTPHPIPNPLAISRRRDHAFKLVDQTMNPIQAGDHLGLLDVIERHTHEVSGRSGRIDREISTPAQRNSAVLLLNADTVGHKRSIHRDMANPLATAASRPVSAPR